MLILVFEDCKLYGTQQLLQGTYKYFANDGISFVNRSKDKNNMRKFNLLPRATSNKNTKHMKNLQILQVLQFAELRHQMTR
jgi:hypothetical protein